MKKLNKSYDEPDFDDTLLLSDEDEFEIGQHYEEEPDKKVVCKRCKGDRWIVGVGGYHTSIKCPNCKYEICIHEG